MALKYILLNSAVSYGAQSFVNTIMVALFSLMYTLVLCLVSYGMKEVNGVPRLAGPGLETMDVPGVTAMGGKWPGRLVSAFNDLAEAF